MFKGSDIPTQLNTATLLDRTLWVFKNRPLQYLLISLCTYGTLVFVVGILYFSGILPKGYREFYGWFYIDDNLITLLIFVSLPAIVADVAIQEYTSALVRDKEIPWFTAVKRAFSKKLLTYLFAKLVGLLLLVILGAVGLIMFAVPFVGPFFYIFFIVGFFSFFVGLAPAIIVEENKSVFSVVSRNVALCRKQFGVTSIGSASAFIVSLALMLSGIWFFLAIGGLIIALLSGGSDLMMTGNDQQRFLFNLMVLVVPLVFAVFYIPLKSIFYSVMYYGFRSTQEGFDLENKLNLYNEKMRAEEAEIAQTPA